MCKKKKTTTMKYKDEINKQRYLDTEMQMPKKKLGGRELWRLLNDD